MRRRSRRRLSCGSVAATCRRPQTGRPLRRTDLGEFRTMRTSSRVCNCANRIADKTFTISRFRLPQKSRSVQVRVLAWSRLPDISLTAAKHAQVETPLRPGTSSCSCPHWGSSFPASMRAKPPSSSACPSSTGTRSPGFFSAPSSPPSSTAPRRNKPSTSLREHQSPAAPAPAPAPAPQPPPSPAETSSAPRRVSCRTWCRW